MRRGFGLAPAVLVPADVGGALEGPSAYLMKSPPKQIPDDDAHAAVERFIKQYARKKAKAAAKT
jgi:myo-inositol-1-phosphate synthase